MKEEIKKCQNCKKDFKIESEDFEFYEKMKVPAPTWCPDCRLQRRLSWRNERFFHKETCDKCQKNIISIFKNEKTKVYCQNCYWSDGWDALDYGREYNFSKPFFEQFIKLFQAVPQINLNGHASNQNSPYANYVVQSKNAYYCFGGGNLEDVMFTNLGMNIKNSAELFFSINCEYSYELLNSTRCNNVFFSNNIKDCFNCYFLQDCNNCNDCIMSCNLRNKSYVFENKQYSKEEYLIKKANFLKNLQKDISKIKNEFQKIIKSKPKRFANILKSNNCTGDNISESSNITNSFNILKGENIKNSQDLVNGIKDTYDTTSVGLNTENSYESLTMSMNIANVRFSSIIRNNSTNIDYSYSLNSSTNCFGCIGLKNKQYCILNKQYSKEEYFTMIEKIKKQMNDLPYTDKQGNVYKYGEFFPPELSPFAYNETIAQEYFPLTKEEALEQGYSWKDREERNYQITLKTEDIPDDIKDVDSNITKEVIECATTEKDREKTNCTEAFKIIPSELEFYKKMNISLPRYCPNCRHHHRLQNRNPLKLYTRTCMKEGCNNEFETTYAPERPEIVYCESCYQNEVV